MNRIKKNITVRFFSVDAKDDFFGNFTTNFLANRALENASRILKLKAKKHLIKLSDEIKTLGTTAYAVTVVRERNTWQAKATSNGKITGISLNQGIIGDPYYFFIVPSKKVLLGFTTGPSGSLKSVGKSILDQFQTDREERIKLNLIPKEKEFAALRNLPGNGNLTFKIDPTNFSNISPDAPQLIQDLSSSPYIEGNTELALRLEFTDTSDQFLSKDDIIEIVDYLSDHEGCKMLRVKSINSEGSLTQLDFVNAYLSYKEEVVTRNKFIDEKISGDILLRAFSEFVKQSAS